MRAVVVSPTYIDPATRGKLRALVGLGCTISVAVPARWAPTARGPVLTAAWGDDGGLRIVPIPVSGERGDQVRWSDSDLHRLFSEFRPDIVQIEAEPATPAAAAASARAEKLGIPATIFSWESIDRRGGMMERWRRQRTLGRARALVAGNRMAARLLGRDRGDVQVAVIPQLGLTPPLDIQRPHHADLSISFVGRLVPEKGLDVLLRACVKMLGRWKLTVIGSGPEQESLEALAEKLGIASRITWHGPLPAETVRQMWAEIDCLVVPSRTTAAWVETYHATLIEAMGHGVTVIGSDSGALPELIDTAGLVVPEGDPPALTTALQHLADSPRERTRLGREARLRVMEEYVDDAVARRTLEFWERALRA
jgi:glycosyltransferase involved in cell wall biosynthesis